MENNQPSNTLAPIILNDDFPFRKSTSSRLDSLYEITHSEVCQISDTILHLLNPYADFAKPSPGPIRKIRSLIQPQYVPAKEYIQASKFSQHPIMATQDEQFITLQLPAEFPKQWMEKGQTHLHFGAVRLALTYHGRKGLPVAARIALLDSRYEEYQHAVIGTIQTTLNAGTVFVTLYPNFCMSLKDPRMLTALQVQVQLYGPKQSADSIEATLHYQMSYRVQNHAIDTKVVGSANEALFINADYCHPSTPTCLHVPRQITREELMKMLPDRWVTSYEKLNEVVTKQIQSTQPKFTRTKDGKVITEYEKPQEKEKSSSSLFPTMFMMQPIPSEEDFHENHLNTIIHSFQPDGSPTYNFRDPITKHCFWDTEVCPPECDCKYDYEYDTEEEDDRPASIKRKKKLQQEYYKFHRRKTDDDDDDFSMGTCKAPQKKKQSPVLPCYQEIYKWQKKYEPISCQKEFRKELKTGISPPPIYMFSPRKEEFPETETFEVENILYTAKIPKPTGVDKEGDAVKNSVAETVLNWQSENALAQNRVLRRIDDNITTIREDLVITSTRLESKIEASHQKTQELLHTLQRRLDKLEAGKVLLTPSDDPEAEIARLKRQISLLKGESVPEIF